MLTELTGTTTSENEVNKECRFGFNKTIESGSVDVKT
jgi:hypothetical protein